jgi:glycerol kinase
MLIAALDQGTLSSRCLIFGNRTLKAVRSLEHRQYHPHAG